MAAQPTLSRRAVLLLVAAAVCYAVGYPLALIGDSNVGWIFVTLGGPMLLGAVLILVRRLYLSAEASRRFEEPPPEG